MEFYSYGLRFSKCDQVYGDLRIFINQINFVSWGRIHNSIDTANSQSWPAPCGLRTSRKICLNLVFSLNDFLEISENSRTTSSGNSRRSLLELLKNGRRTIRKWPKLYLNIVFLQQQAKDTTSTRALIRAITGLIVAGETGRIGILSTLRENWSVLRTVARMVYGITYLH